MQVLYQQTLRKTSRAQLQWSFSNCIENVRNIVTLHHLKSYLYERYKFSEVPLRFTIT